MGEKMPGWRGFVAAVAVEVRAGPGWELGSANYAARGQLLLLAGVQPEQKMQTVTICTAKFLTGSSGGDEPDLRPSWTWTHVHLIPSFLLQAPKLLIPHYID